MKSFPVKNFWFSWRALALYSPVSLISIPVALTNTEISFSQMTQISLLLTGVSLSGFALLILLKKFVPKATALRSTVFVFGALGLGAIRGQTLSELLSFYQVSDASSALSRIVSSSFSTLLWLLLLCLLSSSLEENRNRYQNRFANKALAEAGKQTLSEAELAQEIDELKNIKVLKQNLSQIADLAKSEKVSEEKLLFAAAKLREQIENSLRPLSHRIWFNENLNRPQFRIAGLLGQALRQPWFSPVLTSLAVTLWFIVGAYSLGPAVPVLLKAALSGALLLTSMTIAKRLLRDRKLSRAKGALVFLGISGLSHGGSDLLVLLITGQGWVQDAFSNFILLTIFVSAVLIIVSSLRVLRLDLELLDQMLEEASLLGTSQVRSRFAGYLHNSLQAELTSLAIRLEQAASKDEGSTARAIARLEEIANRSIGSDFTSKDLAPAERLAKVISGWEGIAEVQISICPELEKDTKKFALFVELTEEAIANAVRHADGKEIQIQTAKTAEGIAVTIINSDSRTANPKGLGTSWLERYASAVTTTVTSRGRELRAVL